MMPKLDLGLLHPMLVGVDPVQLMMIGLVCFMLGRAFFGDGRWR